MAVPRSHRRALVGRALVAAACGAMASATEPGTGPTGPVVAAFERFGRTTRDPLSPAAAGRLLVGELGCTACHASADERLAPKRGPDLAGVGARLRSEWIADYLDDPQAAAPGTTMPLPLADIPAAERAAVIRDLVAYLASLRAAVPLPKASGANPIPPAFWERGAAASGRVVYHRVGCVACHDPLPGQVGGGGITALEARAAGLDDADRAAAGLPATEAPFRSVPLAHVGRKYTPRGLAEFLFVPLHARPAGRMPDMKLKAMEAADVAAALIVPQGGSPAREVSPPAMSLGADDPVARGRAAFVASGCAACHAADAPPAPVAARPLADLRPDVALACIAADAGDVAGAAPAPVRYRLDGVQRAAVGAAIAGRDPTSPSPLETSLQRFNCLGCHERDGRGGVGPGRAPFFETLGQIDLGDEGRLPPPLTGVGVRLTPGWFAKVFSGSGTIRPFMRARMPIYPPAATKPLAGWMRAADRQEADGAGTVASWPPPGDDVAAGGAALEGAARILDAGCIQCHPIGDHTLPGVVGVNLADVTRRVEPTWFRRLLLHPQGVRPLTKMPTFFGDTRPRTILEGDAERQMAAVWHWLDRQDPAPLPEKFRAAAAGDWELVPRDRPIVFRTFMSRAGTRAIAVGFPAGVHLAFDADHCRVAEVWRGRFLDARGTWLLAKSAPPTDPLGDAVMPLDDATAAIQPLAADAPWTDNAVCRFDGYRLDDDGVPVFRWRIDGRPVTERWAPTDAGGLARRLAAAPGAGPPLHVRLAHGALVAVADGVTRGDGLSITRAPTGVARPGATSPAGAPPGLRVPPGSTETREWIVPLPADGTPLEVIYRW